MKTTAKKLKMTAQFATLDAMMDTYFELKFDGRMEFKGTQKQLKQVMNHFNKMKPILFSEDKNVQKMVSEFVAGLYIHTQGKCATFIKISELIGIEAKEIVNKCESTGHYSDQSVVEMKKTADNADKWHQIEQSVMKQLGV